MGWLQTQMYRGQYKANSVQKVQVNEQLLMVAAAGFVLFFFLLFFLHTHLHIRAPSQSSSSDHRRR